MIYITSLNCNLKCPYCYFTKGIDEDIYINTQIIEKIKPKNIRFFGAEISLNNKVWWQIVDIINNYKNIHFFINTNLTNEKFVKFLIQNIKNKENLFIITTLAKQSWFIEVRNINKSIFDQIHNNFVRLFLKDFNLVINYMLTNKNLNEWIIIQDLNYFKNKVSYVNFLPIAFHKDFMINNLRIYSNILHLIKNKFKFLLQDKDKTFIENIKINSRYYLPLYPFELTVYNDQYYDNLIVFESFLYNKRNKFILKDYNLKEDIIKQHYVKYWNLLYKQFWIYFLKTLDIYKITNQILYNF